MIPDGYYDPHDHDWEPEDDDWQPGECDRCWGGDVNGVTATGPLGNLYCACHIGQGAPDGECQCGPGALADETEGATA